MQNEEWVAMKQESTDNAACDSPGDEEGEDDVVQGAVCREEQG